MMETNNKCFYDDTYLIFLTNMNSSPVNSVSMSMICLNSILIRENTVSSHSGHTCSTKVYDTIIPYHFGIKMNQRLKICVWLYGMKAWYWAVGSISNLQVLLHNSSHTEFVWRCCLIVNLWTLSEEALRKDRDGQLLKCIRTQKSRLFIAFISCTAVEFVNVKPSPFED